MKMMIIKRFFVFMFQKLFKILARLASEHKLHSDLFHRYCILLTEVGITHVIRVAALKSRVADQKKYIFVGYI